VLQCIVVCCSACCAVCWSVPPLECYASAQVLLLWNYVAVCCSVLQCVAVCCIVLQCVLQYAGAFHHFIAILQHRYYSSGIILQCVAVCCTVLQCVALCVAVCCSVPQLYCYASTQILVLLDSHVLQCAAVRCSVL